MILFGGLQFAYDGPSTTLNDVWALSLGPDPQWSEILPSGTRPRARYYHVKGGI
jgi:hypothetical protein